MGAAMAPMAMTNQILLFQTQLHERQHRQREMHMQYQCTEGMPSLRSRSNVDDGTINNSLRQACQAWVNQWTTIFQPLRSPGEKVGASKPR
jgi:hypothetical protein